MRTKKERKGAKEKASIFSEKIHPMNINKEFYRVTGRNDGHGIYTEGKMILAECVHSLMCKT